MKNKELREMMTKLYRLIEKYENPPQIEYQDDAERFFRKAGEECCEIFNQYKNVYARKLVLAFYDGLGELFKMQNGELKERPKQEKIL